VSYRSRISVIKMRGLRGRPQVNLVAMISGKCVALIEVFEMDAGATAIGVLGMKRAVKVVQQC
jgi:hypothetical protein